CPANTVAVGQYTLSIAGQHPAGECKSQLADGGLAAVAPDAGTTKSGTLCTADAGTGLWLAIAGNGQKAADFFVDGGFQFSSHVEPTPGTACVCAVAIDETISGYVTGAWDGSFAAQPDGGLPLITGFNATIVDHFNSDAGGCICALP